MDETPARKRYSWIGQALLYAVFALIIGVFSHWPTYRHLADDEALIKLSFTHAAQRVDECRKLTPQELGKLPPNMRTPMKCERERSPVTIEVDLDGTTVYRHVAVPSGLSRDGASASTANDQAPSRSRISWSHVDKVAGFHNTWIPALFARSSSRSFARPVNRMEGTLG